MTQKSGPTTQPTTREKTRKTWTPLPTEAEASTLVAPAYVALGASWRRALQAENAAPRTLTTYLQAQRLFGVFLARHQLPQDVRSITRAQIEQWIVSEFADGYAPGSVNCHFRALHAWFTWLEEEEEIADSPMRRMKAPKVPETYERLLTDAEVRAILAACDGKTFADRRDLAIISLLFDTGMRRSELASSTLERLNLDEQFVVVAAKNRRDRIVAFGKQTVRVLDRYLRMRAAHPHADAPYLFIGQRGRTTGDGVYQMLVARARQAGIAHIHPHMLRHLYSHLFLEAGGQESDLMAQAGWRSPAMVRHYGRALREQRAREAAKKLSPADRMAAGG